MTMAPETNGSGALAQAADAAALLDWNAAADILASAGASREVLDKRAFYLSRAKRYPEALDVLAELRRREPAGFMAYYMTGYQYYMQQSYAEAVRWFDEALKRRPDHIKLNWRRAYALSAVGRQADALDASAKVLRLFNALPAKDRDPHRQSFAKASHMLGKAALDKGRALDAIDFLKQAAEADPSDPYHVYLLGKARRRAGLFKDAITDLRRARGLKPSDTSIELELAACLLSLGDKEGCISAIAQVESRCRGWLAYKAGTLAHRSERPELAIRLLQRAAQDRDTRAESCVAEALNAAMASLPPPNGSQPLEETAEIATFGAVAVVNPDKGFGFLVDESGIRRHFKLRGRGIQKGDRVRFVPAEAPKGPAARDVVRV